MAAPASVKSPILEDDCTAVGAKGRGKETLALIDLLWILSLYEHSKKDIITFPPSAELSVYLPHSSALSCASAAPGLGRNNDIEKKYSNVAGHHLWYNCTFNTTIFTPPVCIYNMLNTGVTRKVLK